MAGGESGNDDYEDGDEDDDDGDDDTPSAEDIKKKMERFRKSALENPDSLFNPGTSESNVMGDEYLEAPLTIPGVREQEIQRTEAPILSQD